MTFPDEPRPDEPRPGDPRPVEPRPEDTVVVPRRRASRASAGDDEGDTAPRRAPAAAATGATTAPVRTARRAPGPADVPTPAGRVARAPEVSSPGYSARAPQGVVASRAPLAPPPASGFVDASALERLRRRRACRAVAAAAILAAVLTAGATVLLVAVLMW